MASNRKLAGVAGGAALVALGALGLAVRPHTTGGPAGALTGEWLAYDGTTAGCFLLADTPAARSAGLSPYRDLGPYGGMAFYWPEVNHGAPVPTNQHSGPQALGVVTSAFWMHDTAIPLTVSFIDGDGRVFDQQTMTAESTDVHRAPAPYWWALETPTGSSYTPGMGQSVRGMGTC